MRRFFGILLVFAAASCVVSIDESRLDHADVGTSSPDASSEVADAKVSHADGGGAGPTDAAGHDAGVDAAPFCPNGAVVPGANSFQIVVPGGSSLACNTEEILVQDGTAAGLDRNKGNEAPIDGKQVTGCIGIDFEQTVHLTGVRIHGGPVGDACGATPCQAIDGGCGTGHTVSVFSGPNRNALKHLDGVTIDTNGDYTAYFPQGGGDVATIAICRDAWASERDDMAIDYVAGICQ